MYDREALERSLDNVKHILRREPMVTRDHGVVCGDICEDVSAWCGTPAQVAAFVAAIGGTIGKAGVSRWGKPQAGESTAWLTLPDGTVLGALDYPARADSTLTIELGNEALRTALVRLYPDAPPHPDED